MSAHSDFHISQGLTILPPRSDNAYPIPCEEWAHLKGRVSSLTSEPWFFHSAGFLLLGASLSTLIAVFLTPFELPNQQRVLDAAWGIFAVTGISGLACIFFAHKERGVHRDRASDVVAQMDLIEKRFDRSSA